MLLSALNLFSHNYPMLVITAQWKNWSTEKWSTSQHYVSKKQWPWEWNTGSWLALRKGHSSVLYCFTSSTWAECLSVGFVVVSQCRRWIHGLEHARWAKHCITELHLQTSWAVLTEVDFYHANERNIGLFFLKSVIFFLSFFSFSLSLYCLLFILSTSAPTPAIHRH